jgi:hypothetical protein
MHERTGISQDDDGISIDPVRQAEKRRMVAEAKRLIRERLGEPKWASSNCDAPSQKTTKAEKDKN